MWQTFNGRGRVSVKLVKFKCEAVWGRSQTRVSAKYF